MHRSGVHTFLLVFSPGYTATYTATLDGVLFALHRLGHWMRHLGVINAANLDGGRSATMWLAGRGVVNHPTDSTGERSVSNVVVILPGADPNEVVPRAVVQP